MQIGILGAGIVGLNTALYLQQEFPTAEFTLIAEKFDEDTTSHVAAGLFRPGTEFRGPNVEITNRWITDSYNFYDGILQSEDAIRAGVTQVSGYIFASEHSFITKNDIMEKLVPVYRNVTEDELQICSGNWKYGSYFTTMVIDSTKFLPWARTKYQAAGGRVSKRKIENFQDLERVSPTFDVVFNCTGFGSRWLCNDAKLVPIRGQVLKVKAPWIKMFFYGDYDTHIIPGGSYVTLGGCRQIHSYNTSVCRHDANAIWERCTSLLPNLKAAKIEQELVGLRPYREIVRCELEELQLYSTKEKTKVIHDYGHGGYGVTSSPGTAKYSVEIFRESLRSSNNSSINCFTPIHNLSSTCPSRLSKL